MADKVVIWSFEKAFTYRTCMHQIYFIKTALKHSRRAKIWIGLVLLFKIPYYTISRLFGNQRFFNSYFKSFRNLNVEEFETYIKEELSGYFTHHLNEFVYPKIEEYKSLGYKQYIIGSSPEILLKHIVSRLELDGYIGSILEQKKGRFTRKTTQRIVSKSEKKKAFQNLLEKYKINSHNTEIIAYGSKNTDSPLLKLANKSYIVNPQCKLKRKAKKETWEIIKEKTIPYPYPKIITFNFYLILKMWLRSTKGIYNIPAKGPVLLIANHSSYLDHYTIGTLSAFFLKRRVHFAAKKEHFIKNWENKFHRYFGAIPIDRAAFRPSSVKNMMEVFDDQNILLIYPEGTRSPDGKMKTFKKGFLFLQQKAKVPIVPVYIHNAHELLPKGKIVPRFGKDIEVIIGEQISYEDYQLNSENEDQLMEMFKQKVAELEQKTLKNN